MLERLIAGAFVALAVAPAFAGTTYCCTDDKGRQTCSDVLPAQCYGRAYREITERGMVRRVDAPLTSEQRAQQEALGKARQEEARRATEQRRRDQALLDTYANEQEIDMLRDRSLGDAQAGLKQLEAQQASLLKRQQQLATETEFYRNKPAPRELRDALRANDAELQSQRAAIEAKKKEMDAIRAKYAGEKARYSELTHLRNASAEASR